MVGQRAELPQIIDFIGESAEETGVDPDARFDLQLAGEEACTTIIEHAYGGRGGTLEVCFEARGRDVVITLRDSGEPFDPSDVSQPDLNQPLEEREIGGLGLHLMNQLMDEVRFSFGPEGNTLVMIKRNIIQPARWADAA